MKKDKYIVKENSAICILEISIFIENKIMYVSIINRKYEIVLGLHGGVVFSTVTSQQMGLLIQNLGPLCLEFACSPRVCEGSYQVLWLPPTIPKHVCEVDW